MGCGQSAVADTAVPRRKATTRKLPGRTSDSGGGKQDGGSDASAAGASQSSRGSKRGPSSRGNSRRDSKGGRDGKWWSNVSGASSGEGDNNSRAIRRSQSDHFADRLVINASKANVADVYDIGHTLGAFRHLAAAFGGLSLTRPLV